MEFLNSTGVNTAVTIAGIVIGLPAVGIGLWKLLKLLFARVHGAGVDTAGIEKLADNGLIVANGAVLADREFFATHNVVYFPVVPTSRPNLIHVLFCHYARVLSSRGLQLNMFVFDHYYYNLSARNRTIAKEDVRTFIRVLNGYGLNGCRKRIIQESKCIGSASKLRRMFKLMIGHSHDLNLGSFKSIQEGKWYIDDNAGFARFLKPIFNMVYLTMTSRRYGFTLSGEDERPLWDAYLGHVKAANHYRLCSLYIPRLGGIGGAGTSVLDTANNICFGDDRETILKKLRRDIGRTGINEGSCIATVLRVVLFGSGGSLECPGPKGKRVIASWDELKAEVSSQDKDVRRQVFQALATYLYRLINNRPAAIQS